MCNVSMVMDTWRPYIPQQWPSPYQQPRPVPPVIVQPPVVIQPQPIVDPKELRELIAAFRQAVKAAEVFDRLTGQPDCVDPEKAQLIERVAELEAKLDAIAEAASGSAA